MKTFESVTTYEPDDNDQCGCDSDCLYDDDAGFMCSDSEQSD